MVGRASLQCFWVNPKVTDSFLPHSLFLCFFDYHRLTYLLPESSFCLCNFGLWLCSHFIWLKIALWQIHNIRFLRFTHQKNAQCPYKSCVDPGKQSMPSEGGDAPCSFLEPFISASVPWLPLLISHPHKILKFLLICLFPILLLIERTSVTAVHKR